VSIWQKGTAKIPILYARLSRSPTETKYCTLQCQGHLMRQRDTLILIHLGFIRLFHVSNESRRHVAMGHVTHVELKLHELAAILLKVSRVLCDVTFVYNKIFEHRGVTITNSAAFVGTARGR
jgi:hypothetical protein